MVLTPSISQFERGRGGGVVLTERTPPSCNLSEGGVGGGVPTKETHPPSHVSSEEGGGWMQQHDKERCLFPHHVGFVVVSKLN